MYVEVLTEIKARNISKTFTYLIPSNLDKKAEVGKRVLIPFNNQVIEGFILRIHNEVIDYEVKSIIDVIDDNPVLNSELLKLGEYISKKTLTNLINCYQTMLPRALKASKKTSINIKYVNMLRLIKLDYMPRNEKETLIINILKNNDIEKSVLNRISITYIKYLINNKVIEEYKLESYRLDTSFKEINKNIILNDEQINCINNVVLNDFNSYLLHGVTGSGKTEVYMNIIEKVINDNKEVIVLVPEISLTPQIVNVFKNRFGSLIAILHSALSDGEKYDEWRKIEAKEVKIVIGARSAIFAPFNNLGLIIIDEEHSNTYKQENTPKYSTIDIALFRAKYNKCPLILGSATPSLESYTRAKLGIYKLLEMKNRINKNLPKVTLVDMKEENKLGNNIISSILLNKIEDRLNKREQILILLNRRGYNTVITCPSCGSTTKCPNCDIPLIYHKVNNVLTCHYCNYIVKNNNECKQCHNKDLNYLGLGTQKLEEYLQSVLPEAKIVRMDVDTTRNKGSHKRIISDFEEGKYNILIGTQMIAKGLDFPNVTLVGVLNSDASLFIPDYRSNERTFQLINQVTGRAGRGSKEGEVIIQGFNVDNFSIVLASNNDYLGFYNEEMKIRKQLNYPPYINLSTIKIKSKDNRLLNDEANKIKNFLQSSNNIIILGPSYSNMPKINNVYNMQIMIKYKKYIDVESKLIDIINMYKGNKHINVDIDINSV